MHYAAFLPHLKGTQAEALLAEAGVTGLLRPGDLAPSAVELMTSGPDGLPGTIISWIDSDRPNQWIDRWDPAAMNAIKAPECFGRFYLITSKTSPVKPRDLLRKTHFEGLPTLLGDGREWMLPNQFRLPTCFAFDDNGQRINAVKKEHQPLWDRMQWALAACRSHIAFLKKSIGREVFTPSEWASLENDAPKSIDPDVAASFCEEMLAVNYRVTPWICSQLELFDAGNYWRCLARVTDAVAIDNLILDLQKKTAAAQAQAETSAAAISDTSSGVPA
jgi:hypothetical protein